MFIEGRMRPNDRRLCTRTPDLIPILQCIVSEQGQRRAGHCPPDLPWGGQRGQRCLFITVS